MILIIIFVRVLSMVSDARVSLMVWRIDYCLHFDSDFRSPAFSRCCAELIKKTAALLLPILLTRILQKFVSYCSCSQLRRLAFCLATSMVHNTAVSDFS